MLLRIVFSALGFGHYTATDVLATRNGKAWRFHGEMPVPLAVNTDGENLATIDLCGEEHPTV